MNDMVDLPKVKVLFLDDEENILSSLKRLMMDEEVDVLTANSGRDALELLKEHADVALIVSDQRMPGMTGVEFLMEARLIAPEALRILLTGYADINATIDAINKGGASRYITKPWNDDEILQVIRDAVQKYLLLKENRRLTEIVTRQNEELTEWNGRLKSRVLEQTAQMRRQNEELHLLNERLSNSFSGTIEAFASLIELRDREGRNHARNVAVLAAGMAIELQLSREETESVRVAGTLHDIGKIGIPDRYIALDAIDHEGEGSEDYRQHPVRGQAALDMVEDLRDAGLLIRHHHEHFNGTGFPDRLSGDAIPLGARIIAMADFADRAASRSRRSAAAGHAEAMVKSELGTRFDPSLFAHLIKPLKTLYAEIRMPGRRVEEEVDPRELLTGMILARDLFSGTGLLLLSAGVEVDRGKIALIRRYFLLDPPKSGVFVLTSG